MDPLLFQLVLIVAAAVTFMTVVRTIGRVIEARRLSAPPRPPEDLLEMRARLDRIEQIVETTALEVERISEANRFMARLLAERTPVAAPHAVSPERVVTPH